MVLPNLLYAAFFTLEENVRFYGQKEMSTYLQWENAVSCDWTPEKIFPPNPASLLSSNFGNFWAVELYVVHMVSLCSFISYIS